MRFNLKHNITGLLLALSLLTACGGDNGNKTETDATAFTVHDAAIVEVGLAEKSLSGDPYSEDDCATVGCGLQGMLVAQRPLTNVGYICGTLNSPNSMVTGRINDDPASFDFAKFDCPENSDSIVFFVGNSIQQGLILGNYPFYDQVVQALEVISLVDLIDDQTVLSYDHDYILNLAYFLEAITVYEGAIKFNQVMRVPDVVNQTISSWLSAQVSGDFVTFTSGFFQQGPIGFYQDLINLNTESLLLNEAETLLDYEGQPHINGFGVSFDVATGSGDAELFTSLREQVRAKLVSGGEIVYAGAYNMVLMPVNFGTGHLISAAQLYIDRAGRPYGSGVLVRPSLVSGEGVAYDPVYFEESLAHRFVEDGVFDESLILKTLTGKTVDLKGTMIRRRLFSSNEEFTSVLPLYAFHQIPTFELGHFYTDIPAPDVTGLSNGDVQGFLSVNKYGQVAPLMEAVLLEEMSFPIQLTLEFKAFPWTVVGSGEVIKESDYVSIGELPITILDDGNIITDLDADCATVNFDTLEELDSSIIIKEVPIGFIGHGSYISGEDFTCDINLDAPEEQRIQIEEVCDGGVRFVSAMITFAHQSVIGLKDRYPLLRTAEFVEDQLDLNAYGNLSAFNWNFFSGDTFLDSLSWANDKRFNIDFPLALQGTDFSGMTAAEALSRAHTVKEQVAFQGVVKSRERSCTP